MNCKGRVNKGFTIVQMLIILAGVLLYVWYFSPQTFTQFLVKHAAVRAGVFAESLRDARNAARERNVSVTVCKTASGVSCNSKSQWQDGWMYFVDVNSNGEVDAPDDKILKVETAVADGTVIASKNVVLSTITFAPAGHTLNRQGRPIAGQFVFCDGYTLNDNARVVIFNYQGSVHVESPVHAGGTGCTG